MVFSTKRLLKRVSIEEGYHFIQDNSVLLRPIGFMDESQQGRTDKHHLRRGDSVRVIVPGFEIPAGCCVQFDTNPVWANRGLMVAGYSHFGPIWPTNFNFFFMNLGFSDIELGINDFHTVGKIFDVNYEL